MKTYVCLASAFFASGAERSETAGQKATGRSPSRPSATTRQAAFVCLPPRSHSYQDFPDCPPLPASHATHADALAPPPLPASFLPPIRTAENSAKTCTLTASVKRAYFSPLVPQPVKSGSKLYNLRCLQGPLHSLLCHSAQ